MSSPAALLFDLDGTLVDSIELILRSVEHAFAGRDGPHPTREGWIAGIGTPLTAQLSPFARDDADLNALIDTYRTFQQANRDRLARAYDGTVDVLTALHERGHPTALVTSRMTELAGEYLAHVGLAPFVDVVIGADDTARHKPDPEPVLLALRRLGASAGRALFLGDSPHDIRAGNAAGVVSVAALWGPFTRAQLAAASPAHYLDRPAELPALVEHLFA
ncbi:MAG TPA: HAD-IA family hydrolase [Gemmatimonadaceae bacterium]|nr:HAD-IA family hydrolase [Gemmatimonadaceae bacterium]